MKKITLKIFVLIMVVSSCTMTNNKKISDKISADIDSLKKIYAPDTRVVVWDISVIIENDSVKIIAESDNSEAVDHLKKIISEKYSHAVLNIRLLPENEPERNVHAIVNNSVASIRGEPKHSAELVNQAFLGTPVRILKKHKGWYLAQTPNKYLGWINGDDIVLFNAEQLANFKQFNKIVYKKQSGSSYVEPDISSQVVSDLVIGCILAVTETGNRFYQVQYPDGRKAYVLKDEIVEMMTVFNRIPDQENLVNTAKKFYGIPYLWGGFSSKAIDCSGFTSTVYFLNGVVIQRDASQQIRYGTEISAEFEYKDLLPGDLLFFTGVDHLETNPKRVTHVGIYIGDSEFIHASGKVKINSMDSSRKNFDPEYRNTYIRTMRIIGNVGTESIEKITENKFYKNIIPN